MAYILGIWGEAELFLGIWGAKANTLGRQENYLQGDGDMNAFFSGIKGAQIPWGPQCLHLVMLDSRNVTAKIDVSKCLSLLFGKLNTCNFLSFIISTLLGLESVLFIELH